MTVAVAGLGPYAHAFHDVIEQNMIYHVPAKAAGLSQDAASLTAPAARDTAAVQLGTAQQKGQDPEARRVVGAHHPADGTTA